MIQNETRQKQNSSHGLEVASFLSLSYTARRETKLLQPFHSQGFGVGGHTLGGVLGFINPNQSVCNLKHVVAQADDDELGVFGLFLKQKGFVLVPSIPQIPLSCVAHKATFRTAAAGRNFQMLP